MRLNEGEREKLIAELAARLKDIIYMRAESFARELVNKWETFLPEKDESVDFNYTVHMVGYDILQIIGRTRRENDKGRN